MCVNCIKRKQTKHTKKGATRSAELLEIIYTGIGEPFDNSSFGGEKYLIIFIEDLHIIDMSIFYIKNLKQ